MADAAPGPQTDEERPDPFAIDGGAVPNPTTEPTSVDAGAPTTSENDTACTAVLLPSSQVRLLTQRQYDRTVRDLLGVEQLTQYENHTPSWLLSTDSAGEVTALAWDGYQVAAQAIATQVMSDEVLRSRFITCDLEDQFNCLWSTIVDFGPRAFRRPLTQSELDGFEALLDAGSALPAEEAAQILLETFLISPSFLVRTELNQEQPSPGVFTLSSHEVATRLSYLLWGTMPDEHLFTAAQAGLLTSPGAVLAEAQRMLDDAKARDMINDFVEQYLHMEPGGIWEAAKDEALFPEYSQGVRAAMALETQQFFQHVVLNGGSFADLLQSPVAFVNAETAPLYSLSASDFGKDLEQVYLTDRPGFLTRLGFLSAYSSFAHTSPIRRGAFIVNMLGYRLAPTSAGISTPLPGTDAADTVRKRVELQTAADVCAACHQRVNAFGFALEGFDAVGRAQTTEKETGAPIDTSVEVLIDDEEQLVASASELMHALAQSNQVRTEYARRWVSFALELDDVTSDNCDVTTLAQALSTDGYTQLDLITDLTQLPQFFSRVQETP